MRKELKKEEWEKIGDKIKEVNTANFELVSLLDKYLPKTYFINKWNTYNNAFGRLRSYLDDLVCGRFLDTPDREITSIFYGERDRESIIAESLHLLNSNKDKCRTIILKTDKSPNDIADFLISLHMVLEISINALLRDIIVNNLQKGIDKAQIVDNLDRISFIDKATLFVYMEKYDFDGKISDANEQHKLIGLMKDFSQARNLLMHGSMIGSFLDDGSSPSVAVSRLTNNYMEQQISKFKRIYVGMKFYLQHLKYCYSDKDYLLDKFLNDSFLIK